MPAATSAPYFCRASSDTNLEGLSMGRCPQCTEVKVLSASAHPHDALNAGIRKKSEERVWTSLMPSENEVDVNDVMKFKCMLLW